MLCGNHDTDKVNWTRRTSTINWKWIALCFRFWLTCSTHNKTETFLIARVWSLSFARVDEEVTLAKKKNTLRIIRVSFIVLYVRMHLFSVGSISVFITKLWCHFYARRKYHSVCSCSFYLFYAFHFIGIQLNKQK